MEALAQAEIHPAAAEATLLVVAVTLAVSPARAAAQEALLAVPAALHPGAVDQEETRPVEPPALAATLQVAAGETTRMQVLAPADQVAAMPEETVRW